MHEPPPLLLNGRALSTELIITEGPGRLRRAQRAPNGSWSDTHLVGEGLWPAWSPDGARLVAAWAGTRGKEVRSAVRLLDDGGHDIRDLYVSPPAWPPVIAPRLPHYAQWSPGGDAVSIVAAAPDSLRLYLSDPDGLFTADHIASGAPIFHAWSDNGSFLAIHAGTELSLYDFRQRESQLLASDAAGFRAPVFVGGGLAYCVASGDGVEVRWRDAASTETRTLATYSTGVILQGRGHAATRELSISVAGAEDMGSLASAWTVDVAADAAPRLVARGPFSAAVWSPGGDRLAMIIPTQIGDGRFAVRVCDAGGDFVAATEAFVPSQDMRTFMSFFDQYARSHPIWAPDGGALVLCGRLAGDGVAWSFADRQLDYVWYWAVERGSPLELVGVGDSAFFAPSNGNAR